MVPIDNQMNDYEMMSLRLVSMAYVDEGKQFLNKTRSKTYAIVGQCRLQDIPTTNIFVGG